jgi:hypothetical protein
LRGNAGITSAELGDRLAIRELVDAYAHCADRRDAQGQKSLFTEDTHFVVYMEGQGSSTITLDGDHATGESYCIAHHLFTEDGERKLMVAWLRYVDTFVRAGDAWLFAERNLFVDWTETRPSAP